MDNEAQLIKRLDKLLSKIQQLQTEYDELQIQNVALQVEVMVQKKLRAQDKTTMLAELKKAQQAAKQESP